jgi:PAS domain S-box-containing protein
MNQKWDGIERRKSLRAKAETMVARFYPEHLASKSPEKFLHELLVHKIELELQNEELRLAYASMEDMRDRYLELYEFAPVGYMTLSQEGQIVEINLTGSALFGVERSKLVGHPFSKLIASENQDRWHTAFLKVLESVNAEKQAFDLKLKRADGSLFSVHLECLHLETVNSQPILRVALIDKSKIQVGSLDSI